MYDMWYDKEKIDEIAGAEYDFLIKNRDYARRAKIKKYKRAKQLDELYKWFIMIGATLIYSVIVFLYMCE